MDTENWRNRVAGEIRAHIARAGLRYADIAKQTGMAPSTLSRKLNGESVITVDDLLRIAGGLDIPVKDLLPVGIDRAS